MATFDVNYHLSNARYTQLQRSTLKGLEKVKGVFGMGSCLFRGKMYYLFGGLGFDKNLKIRQNTSQIIEFDPKTNTYDRINLWHKPERLLAERRQLCTLLVETKLLCLGGINKHGYALKGVVCIDLETREWKELATKGEGPGHVHNAAMCLVAYKERKSLRLNHLSEVQWQLVT